jgi:hypothetical protein
MALSSSLEGSIASAVAAQAYVATAIRLAGGPPLAYWRLASTDSVPDEMGTRNGIWKTTGGSLAPGLPQGSDGAVNFAGVAAAEIAHDGGLALPAFTLPFWVRPNSVPGEEDPNMPLSSKDNPGANSAGDFFVAIIREGGFKVRFRDGVGNRDLNTELGVVEVGQTYHVAVRADSTGFDLFVNGVFQGKSTAFTGAWSSNTQNLLLADDPFFAANGDCVLDEVALCGRVLPVAEVLELAQRANAPKATADAAAVPESATTTIDVLSNDSFVGSRTIQIVSQPAGGDSVAVNGQAISYTAGAVAADTDRSFSYRITDPNGTSNTATVSVTVLNTGTPTVSIANCYVVSSSNTVQVGNMAELESAVNTAPPGRQILIQPNTYTGGALAFDPSGTESAPIVVRPRDGRGTVTINAANWTLATGSSRLVIANLFFNNPQITVNGSHHRITRSRFRGVGRYCVDVVAATDTRVDHCDFSDWINDSANKGALVLDTSATANGSLRRVLFDYNYIHDINVTAAISGGSNFVRTTSTNAWDKNRGLTIDHTMIRNTVHSNHGEFIVIKHSGAKIRFCTFENVQGYFQQRAGGGWEVRSCWFEGLSRTSCLQCWDDFEAGEESGPGRQLVIGNRLVGSHQLWIGAGNENGIETADGLPAPAPYHRSRLGRFIGNIVGGGIHVGAMWSNQDNVHPALNNNLSNNTGTVINVNQQGTTFNPDNESFTPAVKLTPSDVGMEAPDPLCPAAPQS